jgi:signal transduction histidine kinase
MNKKSFLSFFLFLFILFNTGYTIGQNRHEIDSLKAVILGETDDEKRVDHLNNLSDLYSDGNVDSAYFFAYKALESATQLEYKNGMAEAHYLLSYFDDRTGKSKEAIRNLEEAIKIYTELGDSSYLAGCYNNLGVFWSYGTDQKKSLEYFIRAMNIAEKLNQTFALSEAYNNIGWYYEYLEEYGSALKYYNKALEIDLKVNNLHNLALSYIMVGNVNLKLQRFDNARDSLLKAQKYITEVKDNHRQTELYINLADYYIETSQFNQAQQQILFAKEINSKDNYEKLGADILTIEGDLLFKQNNYKQCLQIYDRAINIYNELKIHDNLYEIYINKAMAYSELGKFELAYAILQQAQKLEKEFEPNEIAKILSDFEQEEALKEERQKLLLEQEIQNQKNKNEVILIRAKLHGAVVSIIFLLILIGIFVYFYIEKRKHNSILEDNYKIIQEQKALLEENFISLKNNEQKLTRLNATKDKFFSIIAHDLKNPFNVLIGLSDVVISNPDVRHSEDFEQIIDGIFHTAKSGYNLLDNLLKWARTQTGDIEYKPEMLDVYEIFEQNTLFFKETAKSKNIEICEIKRNGQKVFADYNMVNFVVRNLLNNAIKFSYPNGQVKLHAKQHKGFCIFTVQDFGIGMNKETCEKLFSIESTNPKAGTADEMGTGLGLIICKEFVEKSGGKIWVESEEGKGSSFFVSFPCDNVESL